MTEKKKQILNALFETMKKSSMHDRPKLSRLISQVERADDRYLELAWGKWEALKKSADSEKVK